MGTDDNDSRRLGQGMIWAGWLLLLVLLTLFFNERLDRDRNPNRQLEGVVGPDGTPEVSLERNRAGHYIANGFINGAQVEFLVDTGASNVAVPERLAGRLGLERGAPETYQTANGTASGYRTRLTSLRLGRIELRDVPASIHPAMGGEVVLLGMSVLKHLEFVQRGETLILRPATPAR